MNFCFIPWINWDCYLHSRPHQLVREALRRGHRVLYLNPGMRPVVRDGDLEVWHPFSHPFFGSIKKILRREFLRRTNFASDEELTPMRRWVYRPYEEGTHAKNSTLSAPQRTSSPILRCLEVAGTEVVRKRTDEDIAEVGYT